MNQIFRTSFISVLLLIFLLPIFFLPGSLVPLGIAKTILLAAGAIVALVAFMLELLKRGKFEVPSHYILWAVVVFPAIYAISALTSNTPNLSLYGYGLETGTAAFMLIASALFGLTAIIFSGSGGQVDGTGMPRILRALAAILVSFAVVALFGIVKILSGGEFPVWGTFFGPTANPVGSWADYAVGFGMVSVLSALAISTLNLGRMPRVFSYVMLFASLALLAALNFGQVFVFLLIVSIVMLVYLLTVEKRVRQDETNNSVAIWPAIILCAVSLLFIVNPVVSARGTIGDTISGAFGISNSDVRPSLGATVDVSKEVLKSDPLLGAGPGSFSRSWLMHKPVEVNNTVFWNVAFPTGFGFIPTQAATVGLLGAVAWVLFFVFFILLGLRAMALIPRENPQRFAVISTFMASLFLWIASFMYTPNSVMLALTFVMTGLFVAACGATGIARGRAISISNNIVLNFASVLVIVVLGIGSVALGFTAFQKTVSAYHFQKALTMANTPDTAVADIENELLKAIRLVPTDNYYSALSELSLSRAQAVLNSTEGTQEENQETFQNALSTSIAAAQAAVNANPESYRNWVVLGSIYSSLVPAPFSVEGAYDSAKAAYEEARLLSPSSPEIPVLLARLELGNGSATASRAYIEEALTLKQDYVDAYFLLTQLEIQEDNIPGAIQSAETSALLSPDNAGVYFQLGLLRYTNENYAAAVTAFNQALRILPEYANAKYFLALSLDQLDRREEAIALFEELAAANPDNAEIQTILLNLREGREALFGIPTEEAEVESRETPPITETQ